MMKKLFLLFIISTVASMLTACAGDGTYYHASSTSYAAPGQATGYNSTQTPPAPAIGGTTFYTGVPANPPAEGYRGTQTPAAPPSGYYNNPISGSAPSATQFGGRSVNDEYSATQTRSANRPQTAASIVHVVPTSNVIPVGKLVAIKRNEVPHKKPTRSFNAVKSDQAEMLPDVR